MKKHARGRQDARRRINSCRVRGHVASSLGLLFVGLQQLANMRNLRYTTPVIMHVMQRAPFRGGLRCA